MKPYTEEQVRFILDNYIKNEDRCVRETGHSLGSIKLMLQNIAATYGLVNFGTGNPMYTKPQQNVLISLNRNKIS